MSVRICRDECVLSRSPRTCVTVARVTEPLRDEAVPHAPSSQDVAFLVGLMALVEGEFLAGSIDDRLMRRIGERLSRVGLLPDSFNTPEVNHALNAMNYRLRHALGEGDENA